MLNEDKESRRKSRRSIQYFVFSGIVPMFCEEIFIGIAKKKDEGSTAEYEVIR